MSNPQPSDTVMEIARELHPRRYRRFKDLRPDLEADAWARTLDWRNNPYDRFLLRREILHHLESVSFYRASWNIYNFASREEIAADADRLIDKFPGKFETIGVFHYVLTALPWHLAFKHGVVKHSELLAALAQFPSAGK